MAGRDHYRGVPKPLPIDVDVSAISDGAHQDAFDRLRISSPYTVFDSKFNNLDQTFLWSGLADGAGRAEWTPSRSSVLLNVGTDAGDRMVHQTKEYFKYQPGKSQLTLLTGIFAPAQAGLRQRIGHFDDDDGLFFQLSGTELSVVIRTSISGSPVDTVFPQSSWNIDKFDGGGVSGKKIDISKVQIFLVDFQWLGAGRVRFGFSMGGEIYYCHVVDHANVADSVYMVTPDLPCRYEIENLTATLSSSALEQICTSIVSEGGYNPKGVIRGVDTSSTPKTISAGNRYALLSVRLASDNLKSAVVPLDYIVLSTSNDTIHVELILNGELAGPSWQLIEDGNLGIEKDISATTVSGGTHVWSDYTSSRSGGDLKDPHFEDSIFRLAATASGVADTLTVAASVVGGGNANVVASMNIKELQ